MVKYFSVFYYFLSIKEKIKSCANLNEKKKHFLDFLFLVPFSTVTAVGKEHKDKDSVIFCLPISLGGNISSFFFF